MDWVLPITGGWYISGGSPVAHRFRYLSSVSDDLVSLCSLKRRDFKLLYPAPANALFCKICLAKRHD